MIKSLFAIILTAILTENYILDKFLGICPFLGVSKNRSSATGMSIAVTVVMVIATAVTWPIYYGILVPKDLAYLETIVFILVIAVLVQLIEIILRKYIPSLYNALGVYLPLITTNCAVLGVTMLVLDKHTADPSAYGYLQALVNAFGAGIGFLVALVMFSGVRERMELNDVPKFMKGLPITLVAASLVSLSFLGFSGLVNGMLG
ncbi:Electron transport complex subunit RsxA [Caprobacter fermentans]|uniref:Ion-translocating oxidoreductase complex subunit A n=1 Tax=Caproicibacter fermentans TaxID=2576756 RepID=A0A6N8I4G8_9FIRM|nr:RnfABCDGE type electron transport complex subunit A [Caproicibacter fermentans]MVB12393.1 Electron transport complex subunit RsxA [Caproicibacter fermentans]OCN03042.1 electron transport complex RsxE subunit [Clostridium sp. W14A]QNK40621.1 RnfABCDGE type electron transport complex subunit A [Caproicibacter fermentans]